MINIVDLGAKTTNADNAPYIQQAIVAAFISGSKVYIPKGEFKHSGITMMDNVTIKGSGHKSSYLIYTGSGDGINCEGKSGYSIKRLYLKGLATVTLHFAYPTVSNTGIALKVAQSNDFIIKDLKISHVGQGIDYQNNGGSDKRGIFDKIFMEYVYKGVYTHNSGEYANFDKILITKSTFGIHVDSGNNIFTGCQVTKSGVACKLSGGTNNGHGQFIGCTFNHNNYNLDAYDAVSLGETFTGCNFIADITNYGYAGKLHIINCKGIIINGGQIGSNITIDSGSNTQNGANMICNALIRTDLPNYTAPNIVGSGIGIFKNNIDFNGLWASNN